MKIKRIKQIAVSLSVLLSMSVILVFLTYNSFAHEYSDRSYSIINFFEFAKEIAFYCIFVYLIILVIVRGFSSKGEFVVNLRETITYCSYIFVPGFIGITFGQIAILSNSKSDMAVLGGALLIWGFFLNLYLISTYLLMKMVKIHR